MAATTSVVRTAAAAAAAAFRAPPIGLSANHNSPKFLSLPFKTHGIIIKSNYYSFSPKSSQPRSSSGETTETQQQVEEDILDSQLQDNTAGAEDGESEGEGETTDEDAPASAIIAALQSYKEALSSNDEFKIVEIEAILKSVEDEKIALESKVGTLSQEISYERDRVLRISADFDNFRKRTERERLSLVTNAKGEVVENLLPVLDNFERAKSQIKVETEGEEKINNSYQSIYKQFGEILGSLGVESVETTGNPFDPMLHEAIMREDSDEHEEGVILQEFRKGFKLGDRLLRPSMVKVSTGPGPAKPEIVESSVEPDAEIETKGDGEEDTSSEPAPMED